MAKDKVNFSGDLVSRYEVEFGVTIRGCGNLNQFREVNGATTDAGLPLLDLEARDDRLRTIWLREIPQEVKDAAMRDGGMPSLQELAVEALIHFDKPVLAANLKEEERRNIVIYYWRERHGLKDAEIRDRVWEGRLFYLRRDNKVEAARTIKEWRYRGQKLIDSF